METIKTERYEACFGLYLRYGGQNLSRIEREMRALGYADFNRRILYSRKENGIYKPGWIEKYRWSSFLAAAPTGGNTSSSECVLPRNHEVTPQQGKDTLPTGRVSASEAPPPDFRRWLKSVSPGMTWDWKYQKYIYRHLQRVTDGTCKRLMIFLPPRHGKSELVTVRYAGWRLRQDPKMRVILASYNQKLADKFSRSVRKILSEEEDVRLRSAKCGVRNEEDRGHRSEPGAVATGFLSSPPYEGGVAAASADGVVLSTLDGLLASSADADSANYSSIRQHSDVPQCTCEPSHHDQSAVRNPQSAVPQRMFPKTRTINTVSEWETAAGGGVKAVGVGAGVTGFGAQLIVIDDPVKSRAEAESETLRDKLWDWYNNDLYTRLEPGGSMVLIQTRWHHDDLAGRLINEMQNGGDQWDVINLPALSEPPASAGGQFHALSEPPALAGGQFDMPQTSRSKIPTLNPVSVAACDDAMSADTTNAGPHTLTEVVPCSANWPPAYAGGSDPLGRLPGQALCPERYDAAKLLEIKRQLGSYNFSALYQQRPTPAEGGIFKREWFKRILDKAPDGLKWKRGYDLAVSTKTSACYTASFRVAYDNDGNMYIADGFRQRIEFPEQRRYIISRIKQEKDTEHGIEKALHGQALLQDLRREARMRGTYLRGIEATADKLTRALKWAPLAEEGKIILVKGAWNKDFLDEVCLFPSGQFDDQIDAVSIAVTMFGERNRKAWFF